MPSKNHGRQYDVVVFGATGYTGLMTAEHITAKLPTNLKWAIAGRSADKLQKVVLECKALNPDRVQPEIEVVGLNDEDLLALAKKTYILITTVGPYAKYGEHAFKACAESGTHYLDCTGEVVWTLDMIEKYEAKAKETGAIIIPQDGIESAPSDLLTWVMAQLIRTELSAQTANTVVEIHQLNSAPSGGTLATVLNIFEKYTPKDLKKSSEAYALSPVPNPHPGPRPSLLSLLTGLYSIRNLGLLRPSIAGSANVPIVQRTWGLLQQEGSRRAEAYGPRWSYREFVKARNPLSGAFLYYAELFGGALLMFVPLFRALVRKYIFKPGEGPARDVAARDYIEYRGVAEPDPAQGDKQAFVKAWFSGSMYYLTATLLAQAASTLLEDDVDLKGGVYTPACLGQGYIDRLSENGFKIEAQIISK
ncbi:saccharopine dehydrogenase [Xylariales sp. PMI_506]|nr:saccharopine dehydrogenase [Xylariales sp. PMI_506]